MCRALLEKQRWTHKQCPFSIPAHRYASVGWPAKTYLYQLCMDTVCSPEDPPGTMDDRDGWGERVRESCAVNVTW